ncbi:hypothetical protein HB364_30985 [Pseudoflavitalea sp. X16]|jgi:hypothetical protein|uniref:hypothetical protein n=1 Tax=Paraflavitalea devenefica TaxID=2716334 RepID=UPI0014244755|nr:hypothetical protein [Paraflavitalea devenefica]NII29545.1 hypothetical protein [Paraflavitalea devenefica]
MQRLLFFSRVAFICNICFLLTWLMRYLPPMQQGHIASTVVILGIGLSLILNVIINFFIIVLLLQRKPVKEYVPLWLVVANVLFLIAQLILLLK